MVQVFINTITAVGCCPLLYSYYYYYYYKYPYARVICYNRLWLPMRVFTALNFVVA